MKDQFIREVMDAVAEVGPPVAESPYALGIITASGASFDLLNEFVRWSAKSTRERYYYIRSIVENWIEDGRIPSRRQFLEDVLTALREANIPAKQVEDRFEVNVDGQGTLYLDRPFTDWCNMCRVQSSKEAFCVTTPVVQQCAIRQHSAHALL